jgi:endoglucanase
MTEPTQNSRRGEILGGKYRVLRFMAKGGMAAVYETQHLVVKRRFAVKVLRADFSRRREMLERFQREAETAGRLENEHIAAAVDFGVAGDGSPFIVMEYLVGESLDALLARDKKLPVGRAADLCVQVCKGLHAAHAAGIIHRDIKPQNLFICRREDGTDLPKVLDFGIAKLEASEAQSATTHTGMVLGTPFYMSPEQARGDREVDHRTDVYALGAVLFELLSGQKPHPGESNNAILHHIATQPALPLANLAPDVPEAISQIARRALSPHPRDRFASASALGEALAPYAQREVWPEPRCPAQPHSDQETSSSPLVAPGYATPATRSRRGGWKVIVPAALIVGAGLMWLALFRHAPRSSHSTSHPALSRGTQFYTPPVPRGAIQQIASLARANAFKEAGALTAMTSTPHGIWFIGGSPDEVQGAVKNTIARATHEQRVPILVTYNLPFRDCAQYAAGGADDGDHYRAWINAFASAIGNEKAVVILEPDGIGIIPNNTTIQGVLEWCKPTVTDVHGKQVTAPGATPADRYAQLNYAADALATKAPNAAVYLDGTHSGWLAVGEAAYRLVNAGIHKVQGIAVNVAHFQTTSRSIQYATWIAKCIYYASRPASGQPSLGHFADCASPDLVAHPSDQEATAAADAWYAANVDNAVNRPASPAALAHFVIDTSRNGQGIPDTALYGLAPYNQPKEVLDKLGTNNWCNPPRAGLGQRPSTDTGVPLLDAFLWVKTPGESDGSCDMAGSARAWDYSQYNPWGMTGDGQNHFDPLWGMVDPAPGEWFPEQALQLARNANPPVSR